MWWLWIIAGLAAAYVMLVIIPSVISAFFILSRVDSIPIEPGKYVGTHYDKFIPEITENIDYMQALEQQKAEVTAADGTKLRGVYYPGSNKNVTMILVHGFHAHPLMNFAIQARYFHEKGYGLLIIYQRAHLESDGKTLGLGLTEDSDVLCWIDYAKQAYPESKLFLYGASMGCATLGFASDRIDPDKVSAMFMDCGYICPYDQMLREAGKLHLPGKVMMPWVSLTYRLLNRKNPKEKVTDHLKNCKVPVFFLHGSTDDTVPCENTLENFNACGSEKELCTVEGAGHTVAFAQGGDELKQKIDKFIKIYSERHSSQ